MIWKQKEYWIVVVLLMITGIYVNILQHTRVFLSEVVELTELPKQIGVWQIEESYALDEKSLNILKSDKNVWRKYGDSNGHSISLFIGYFKDQKYGSQIHSPKHCVPGGGWQIIHRGNYNVAVHNSPTQEIKINKMINSNGHYKQLMLYWYWTRSGIITSEYGLKIDLAKNALFRNPTDAAFIRLDLPLYNNDQYESLQIAADFIRDIFPAIKQVLPFKN